MIVLVAIATKYACNFLANQNEQLLVTMTTQCCNALLCKKCLKLKYAAQFRCRCAYEYPVSQSRDDYFFRFRFNLIAFNLITFDSLEISFHSVSKKKRLTKNPNVISISVWIEIYSALNTNVNCSASSTYFRWQNLRFAGETFAPNRF